MAAYDKNVDYSDLIAAEAAKGVNADRQLLAELEAARNAKISGENLNYAQTNVYTQELGSPPHYYTAEDQRGYKTRSTPRLSARRSRRWRAHTASSWPPMTARPPPCPEPTGRPRTRAPPPPPSRSRA